MKQKFAFLLLVALSGVLSFSFAGVNAGKEMLHPTSAYTLPKDTTIIGKASNAKQGAIVISSDQKAYYLEGMEIWPSNLYGQTISVTGQLRLIKSPLKKGKLIRGQLVGTMRMLLKPTWTVVQ